MAEYTVNGKPVSETGLRQHLHRESIRYRLESLAKTEEVYFEGVPSANMSWMEAKCCSK